MPRIALLFGALPIAAACGPSLPPCAPDNAGLTLADGFCALIVADSVGRARHITVAPNGDVFVALGASRARGDGATEGGVLVLRDTDGDGVADETNRFGSGSGDDVEFRGDFLYYSTNDAITA